MLIEAGIERLLRDFHYRFRQCDTKATRTTRNEQTDGETEKKIARALAM